MVENKKNQNEELEDSNKGSDIGKDNDPSPETSAAAANKPDDANKAENKADSRIGEEQEGGADATGDDADDTIKASTTKDNIDPSSIKDVTPRKGLSIIKWSEVRNFFSDLRNFLFEEKIEDTGYKLMVEGKLVNTVSRSIGFAYVIVGIFIAIFCLWAGFAPLDSATVASGSIVSSSKRKFVQIPEVGVNSITAVYVKDGDLVTKGQVLFELDPSLMLSAMEASKGNAMVRLANERRILALQRGSKAVDYGNNYGLLKDIENSEVRFVLSTQNDLFTSQKSAFDMTVKKYEDSVEAGNKVLESLKNQLIDNEKYLELEKDHLEKIKKALENGILSQSDFLYYSRNYHGLSTENFRLKNEIVNESVKIAEIKIAKENYKNQYILSLSSEYRENHDRFLEAYARYSQQTSQFDKTKIVAPETGYIMNLQVNNKGAVFQPTAPVAEIVPIYDDLIAEVYVMTKDINNVKVGMKVKLQLVSYKQKYAPRLDGEVIYVSPDKLSPMIERSAFPGEKRAPMPEVFLARIRIDTKVLSKLSANVKLAPGMPVAAFIINGTTTPLKYLISPIRDSLYRTFIEQ